MELEKEEINYKGMCNFYMDLDKKVISALAILLTIGYGIIMAKAGVRIPGFTETKP